MFEIEGEILNKLYCKADDLEPGVEDIQDSQNLFCLSLVDREQLQKAHPDIQINAGDTTEVKQYQYDDTVDTTDKVVVVDWYYNVNTNGKNILHYCKFVNYAVLYASENVPEYAERGYYDRRMPPLRLSQGCGYSLRKRESYFSVKESPLNRVSPYKPPYNALNRGAGI